MTAAALLAVFVLTLFPCGMGSVKAEEADTQEGTETETLPETPRRKPTAVRVRL